MTDELPAALHPALEAAAREAPRTGRLLLDCQGEVLPAAALRELFLSRLPALGPGIALVLRAARVDEPLRLAAVTAPAPLALLDCRLDALDLTDATFPGLAIVGGRVRAIAADRLTVAGSLLLGGARTEAGTGDAPRAAIRSLRIPQGVLLSGARIRGNLDLRGARLGAILGIKARGGGLGIVLLADGLSVAGNALLCDDFFARGEVRLNGAHIARNLAMSSARLRNPGGYTVSAAGARVDGTFYLGRYGAARPATRSVGLLRLSGARIGGDFDAAGATCIATAFATPGWTRDAGDRRDLYAIEADGLRVAASVQLSEGFSARGAISLVVARIGNDLTATGATLSFPGEVTLNADGATVGGCTWFDGASTDGLIRVVQARLDQGLDCEDLRLVAEGRCRHWLDGAESPAIRELGRADLCGIYAAAAGIGGSFTWRGVTRTGPAGAAARRSWLAAPGASMIEVDDDQSSWEAVTDIDLRDCTYTRLSDLVADPARRLARLDRQYAPWNARHLLPLSVLWRTIAGERRSTRPGSLGPELQRFAPSPYLQLAQVYRSAGLESAAQQVALRLERNRTHYSGRNVFGLFRRWGLDLALRHGQSPFRPVLFVLVWAVVSGVAFGRLYDRHAAMRPAHVPSGEAPGPRFEPFFYALDTLVPFIDFGEKKSVVVDPLWSEAGALLLFNTILGYAAAAFLAAGLSGLVRGGRDG